MTLPDPQEQVTGMQMCEFIAEVLRERFGWDGDPVKDIWETDPHGELWPVYDAYDAAKAWRALHPAKT